MMSDYQQEMIAAGPIPGQESLLAPGDFATVPKCRVEELHERMPNEDELELAKYERVRCWACGSGYVWEAGESWDSIAKRA